jgi:hypothetical protein
MDLSREYKGRRAKEILVDPVFVEIIDTARAGILTQWNLTNFDQTETRESLYYQGRALDEILRELRALVDDWAMEKARSTGEGDR